MKMILPILLCCFPLANLFSQTTKRDSTSTYALVIGISDYQNEAIPDLRFADKDALAFADFLKSQAGGALDEDHLKVLVDEEATSGKVGAAFYWLIDECKEGDQVIVYFSGHGDVERKISRQPGFLLCWDAPPKVYMSGGVIDLRMFQDVISSLSIDTKAKVTIITDACRSGKLSGNNIGGAQITGANLAKQFGNEIKILSCQPDEYSVEGEQWGGGRGVFSYHLLEGLYGMADSNEDLKVNLKEIGRYLEDRVTEEASPVNQNPMIIGNKMEKITFVNPEILAKLKEGKKGQVQLFNSTASRGIEDDVLAQADSNIVELYFAFKAALKDKQFLFPEDKCADFYYEKLSKEPQLERLHASMRRNYAAELQDDAQQVMNRWLSYDSQPELTLSKQQQIEKYQSYPSYLKRAAELLGEDHYMYPALKARGLFFEASMMHIWSFSPNKPLGEIILSKYREALQWQADAPHVYFRMMAVYHSQMQEPDSAEYCAQFATELVPNWFLPYSYLGWLSRGTEPKKARYFLELADQIDTVAIRSSIIHQLHWANFYSTTGNNKEAEVKYLKAIQLNSRNSNVNHLLHTNSRIYGQLGTTVLHLGRPKEAEQHYKKAIQIESTNVFPYIDLGWMYCDQNRFDEAEQSFKKAIQIDLTEIISYNGLGWVYMNQNRFVEAEQTFKKAIQVDSTNAYTYNNLGAMYRSLKRFDEAEQYLKKAIQLNATSIQNYNNLGSKYMNQKRFEEAERMFRKALSLHDQNESALYNMARLNSLQENKKEAFNWLKKVLILKIIPYEKYQSDRGFDHIQDTKAFKRLMKKYFPEELKE